MIACGGTGGHLFPGLAVAEEWSARGGRVLLLVSEKKIDQEASRKYSQYRFETIPAAVKPPTFSPRMVAFAARLWRTIGHCRRLFDEFKPAAVLGMGGFTSLPPVYAGTKRRVPGFIHDSNARPGRANVMTSRWCREVFIGLEPARDYFPKRQCVVTGTPVRAELRELPERAEAAARFGFDPMKSTLLVMGGSQGARQLNKLVARAGLPEGVQVLHIAGPGDQERVESEVRGRGDYKVLGFCDDMPAAYAVADAVVARSGASSLTELSYLGLPSILVPFPFAADDHQTRNAEVFRDAGAAFLEPEDGLDASRLAERIEEMLDLDKHTRMSDAARGLAVPDAAAKVCDAIEAEVT